MFIDPDHKKVRDLKIWWKKQPHDALFTSITGGLTLNTSTGPGVTTTTTTLALPTGERPDNFKLSAELIDEL
jgi:hypothetical protein